jgi:hypothetical protein
MWCRGVWYIGTDVKHEPAEIIFTSKLLGICYSETSNYMYPNTVRHSLKELHFLLP